MHFGLIGYPLTHSFSKKLFDKKFSNHIPQATYENFSIKNITSFPSLIKNNPSLKGLNVTTPYKKKIIPYLHFLDSSAKNVQSVNTITLHEKKYIGYNTDSKAFEISLKTWLPKPYTAFQALILGTGGAARAVGQACKNLCIAHQYVSRNPKSSQYSYQNLMENPNLIQRYKLVIQCTPLGMYPNSTPFLPFPYKYIQHMHYLYDLIYNPRLTFFLKKGLQKGAKVKNGYEMLCLQAKYAWKIWKL